MGAIPYVFPNRWVAYDATVILQSFVDAKAALLSLRATPHQRDWVETLQKLQLKMEVEGTSRIEGADFTDRELDEALALTTDQDVTAKLTRSQKQARAAAETYRWIAALPDDRPITEDLICEIHRRLVTGCDDDHCAPGKIRKADENVTFGFPRHRGCEGGQRCQQAFASLVFALRTDYKAHDPLIQAIALHYHFAAMHPFLDGNGRTARALEALILQRAGLRDTAFIAMSNYYYEQKPAYLAVLAKVRAEGHDLTDFLNFALRGVALQCDRLFQEMKKHIQKAVFRNMMYDLFHRLQTPRKRVIAERQIAVLKLLLDKEHMLLPELIKRTVTTYNSLQTPQKALIRDVNALITLQALTASKLPNGTWRIQLNLDWPEMVTESDFMERINALPKGKMHSFL